MPIDRTPGAADANTELFDAALRHRLGLAALTNREVRQVLDLLEKLDKEITAKLRVRLKKFVGKPYNPKTKKFKSLLTEIQGIRAAAIRQVKNKFQNSMIDFAKLEASFEKQILEDSLPVVMSFDSVPPETLAALVKTRPFGDIKTGGRTLDQWFSSVSASDKARITAAIQAGLFQGESINDIVRRVVGSRSTGFRDGTLAVTRRQAEAIVRTAINGIANTAREGIWAANADVLEALQWTAVLDLRTTPICQERDGKVTQIGTTPLPSGAPRLEPPGARPPAHIQCRSIMVAVYSSDGVMAAVGSRPFVRSSKNAKGRQKDFRAQAREEAGTGWSSLTRKQRTARTKTVRDAWGDENIGTIPASVSYEEWISRQPASFKPRTSN